jgi:plastocyanin
VSTCQLWRVVAAFTIAAPLAVIGGPPATAASEAGTKVSMKDFAFIPATVTIKAGATVTWTYDESPTDPMGCEGPEFQAGIPNASCPGHSITAVDNGPNGKPLWDSGVHRASGFPFSLSFTTPGTYRYYCTVHGGAHPNNPLTHMDGTVIVQAATAAETVAPASAPSQPALITGASQARASLPNTGAAPSLAGALTLVVAGLALAVARRALTA